jgi:UDP-3-O-[3-hydroxymyristoyl] glucosamine N-acyltransferase
MTMIRARLHEQEIREAIGVPGEGELVVDGVAALDEEEDRSLYWFAAELPAAAREALAHRSECIVIAPAGSSAGELGGCRILEVSDPRAALAKVLLLVRTLGRQPPLVDAREVAPDAAISEHALVEGNVRIGEGVVIGPFCTVGPDVSVGPGSILHPGVRVYPRVSIGEESTIGANTVIGNDGYGFVRAADGNKVRMPQLAGVTIGSHVDIGALVVVEGGAIRTTIVEDHAKLADLVFLGHGVRVERNASITAGVVLAGSSVVGTEAWLGINTSVRDGRRVGAHALVGMDASVQEDLEDGAIARAPQPDVGRRPADDDLTGIGFGYGRKP